MASTNTENSHESGANNEQELREVRELFKGRYPRDVIQDLFQHFQGDKAAVVDYLLKRRSLDEPETDSSLQKINERLQSLNLKPDLNEDFSGTVESVVRQFACGTCELVEESTNAQTDSSHGQGSSEEPEQKKPRMALRSREASTSSRRSMHVLPAECIICQKRGPLDTKKRAKRVKEPLSNCELVDGGLLLKQAINEQNTRILWLIQHQDCVALEVKYHATCYKKFTRPLTRKDYQQQPDRHYNMSFKRFCKDIVEEKLIKEEKAWELVALKNKFVEVAAKVEQVDASSYSTSRLKSRLQSTYPSLRFARPKNPIESDIVYTKQLSAETLFADSRASIDGPSDTDTSTDSEDDDGFVLERRIATGSTLTERYNSALDLKKGIEDIPAQTMPWPPDSSHLTLDTAKKIVPTKLYNFLSWMVGFSDEPDEDKFVDLSEDQHRRILSLSQDIIYLSSKGRKPMPKQTSLAMAVRHITGSAQLIGLLNGFGHATSHTKVLEHDTALAKKEIQSGETKVPSCLQERVFTTLVWDNNDFGEETLSGRGTTHNTNGIAIQHKPAPIDQPPEPSVSVKKTRERTLKAPEEVLVPFFGTKKANPKPLGVEMKLQKEEPEYSEPIQAARRIDSGYFITKYPVPESSRLLPGWTGYNQMLVDNVPPKATIAYLPVIDASPTEMNAVNTLLHRSIDIADYLKLGPVVVVVDQAIYAKAQAIRWQTPIFQQRIVLRLGAFHTAMTFLACIGTRFRDAGLEDILIESEVLAGGSVNGVMTGRHYNRSIRCHKLMAEALHRMRWKSFLVSLHEDKAAEYTDVVKNLRSAFPYQAYTDLVNDATFGRLTAAYDQYVSEMAKSSPTFAFWSSYLAMVDTLLQFTRSSREGNWQLHLASIRSMMPWLFSYNRTNYARYLPIYWMEMKELRNTHPTIHEEFQQGHFAVQRQNEYGFSGVPCDQTIEQTVNKDFKTRGGLKGFTVNKGAVNRWTAGHHERAAIMRQVEEMAGKGHRSCFRKDLTESRMKRDEADVESIIDTISSLTNPFEEVTSTDVVHLASGVLASSDVTADLLAAEEQGDASFMQYCQERLQKEDKAVTDTIRRSKLKTFSNMTKKSVSNVKGKEVVLKSDRDLFARLVIIGKRRQVDLRNMMTYSLGPLPLPIAKTDGTLMKTNKAKLLHMLEDLHMPTVPEESRTRVPQLPLQPPKGGIWIVDAMALLQMMKNIPKTFGEVVKKVFKQLLNLTLETQTKSIHFVTDTYPDVSIKNAERTRRAASGSQRIRIRKPDQSTPKQWKKFLANSHNKQELITFLLTEWQKYDANKLKGVQLVVAHEDQCHTIAADVNGAVRCLQVDSLYCDHEEADTRMLLHAKYIGETSNATPVIIKSPDTDVFVLAVAHAKEIASPLYFHTGRDDKKRTIPINPVQQELGESLTSALIGFHAFTGCDSVSSFYGKGKSKAFSLLMKCPTYVEPFKQLGDSLDVAAEVYDGLERFVCQLYGHKDVPSVNEIRYVMLKTATRSEIVMPPNQDSLRKHIQRANFQASIFKKSLVQNQELPSPVTHRWKMEESELAIDWMDLAPAPESVLELAFCKCKRSKCKAEDADDGCCANLGLQCTDLCQCKNCDNMEPLVVEEDDLSSDSDDEEEDDFDEEEQAVNME